MQSNMIQKKLEQEKSNSNIIIFLVQFYIVDHNSQSNYWIRLMFYHKFQDMLFYIEL